MPVTIDGVRYVSLIDVAAEIGVARQTLWRWRQDGHVPAGHRLRDRSVVFTTAEVQTIRAYAFRVEPATVAPPRRVPGKRSGSSEGASV